MKYIEMLEHIRAVADIFSVAIYWLDTNQKYLGVNAAMIEITGTHSFEQNFAEKTPCDLFPTSMEKDIMAHHKEVVRSGNKLVVEESIKNEKGAIKYFNVNIAPLYDNDGNIIGSIGLLLDLTAEKQEAALLENEEIFKYLKMIAPIVPANMYWLDLNNKVLGTNQRTVDAIGGSKVEDFIGKTPYEYYPKDVADEIVQHLNQVMEAGHTISYNESIKDIKTGQTKHFNAIISPLRDNSGNIIGTIGTTVDVTAEKEAVRLKLENQAQQFQLEKNKIARLEKEGIFKYLKMIAPIVPANMYWLDLNNRLLGLNQRTVNAIGGLKAEDFIGKTPYEFYPHEIADEIVQHLNQVLELGTTMSYEESIRDITTGETKYFNAIISPLRDNNGNIIGTIGNTVDNTAEKEAVRLKLENQAQQLRLQQKEKFQTIANQVAHDIRSPLASLLMIVKSCTEIPEGDRIALREAAISIGDIANSLLSKYKKDESEIDDPTEKRQPILMSAVLLQLLTDKKYQYQNLPIKFNADFKQESYFSFITIEPSAFKRSISNVINNAVDAFDGKEGEINLKLDTDNEWVHVIVQDNGKGMPPALLDKIKGSVSVTEGKKDGHGIGLTQVRETLARNQGEIAVDSVLNQGTMITLTFPRAKTPSWIAEKIILSKEDLVVILDDDTSIHGAWDARFESLLAEFPQIRLKHFQIGNEALSFINNLPGDEKAKVFLLTDYELLKQELNGLHVVEKSKVERSVLVTSHYANDIVREYAARIGTKILPKQLASEIIIQVDEALEYQKEMAGPVQVDLIIIDDDESFVKNLALFIFGDKEVAQYHNPQRFLEEKSQYQKDTKILLDQNFQGSTFTGLELAKILHEEGYTHLYLLSGEIFEENEIPSYLVAIKKDDIERIRNV